ncbi:unnamed protein product [Bemisia tabaci]|uniref:tRNA (uracil(54)-C(5))-methyltransferase n=1 Tax=Bemisia tabaci TaxID=7038 RepID=A0A9P0A1S2_BEMTA|nr:unnamed protein product [Bemisia tabaci]
MQDQSGQADAAGNIPGGLNLFNLYEQTLGKFKPLTPFKPRKRSQKQKEKWNNQPRVIVFGLPQRYSLTDFRRVLTEQLNLDILRVKPFHKNQNRLEGRLMLIFNKDKDAEEAAGALNGFLWRGRNLKAVVSKNLAETGGLKRENDNSGDEDSKRAKTGFKDQAEALKYSQLPLLDVPYQEQLKGKKEKAVSVLKSIHESLVNGRTSDEATKTELMNHLEAQEKKFAGVPCELVGPIQAPSMIGYRVKVELNIGLDENGKKTVGYFVKDYHKRNVVAPMTQDLKLIPDKIKETAAIFQKYVENSQLDVYSEETHQGHWRKLAIRMGQGTNQLAITVHLQLQALSKEALNDIKDDLADFFARREGKTLNATSVYIQYSTDHRRVPVRAGNLELVCGEEFMLEKFCGFTFQISAESSFFQNIKAGEVLLKWVADFAKVNKNTTLIDIGCGVGTIGLLLAKNAGEVIGFDTNERAIDHAQKNSIRNGITNCQFFRGSAKVLLSELIPKAKFNNITAIVDPPRLGLYHHVMVQLRSTENLSRIVYITHSPSLVINDFVSLCHPPTPAHPGRPFVPVKSVAIDMFPNTPSFSLVIVFDRLPAGK